MRKALLTWSIVLFGLAVIPRGQCRSRPCQARRQASRRSRGVVAPDGLAGLTDLAIQWVTAMARSRPFPFTGTPTSTTAGLADGVIATATSDA